MVRFKTMREFNYDVENKCLIHLESGIKYSKYIGVGKVCSYGQPSFFDKLVQTYGLEKARQIQENSVNRGNRIHKKLELSTNNLFPQLGVSAAKEIFLFSRFYDDCKPVQGSLDDLRIDGNGRFHIIEYKSKSSLTSWNKYKDQNLHSYIMQTSAYEALLFKYYKVRVDTVNVGIVFPNNKADALLIPISVRDRERSLSTFLRNLKHFKTD